MCGIVGVAGTRECTDLLLDGLRRLEYRGYDSAGISVMHQGEFSTLRAPGKLSVLENLARDARLPGVTGVGHTRWATHGRPSEANAHPHTYIDTVVVHNGIIENYRELKEKLAHKGHVFSSQTDSEIIAHLIHDEMEGRTCLADGVRSALLRLEGSFAVAVMHLRHPGEIVACKRLSPLVVGLDSEGNYVASDVPALLSRTRRFVFLEDGDLVRLKADAVEITDLLSGEPVERPVREVTWTPAMAEKGGYKHFMMKEIHEQPRALADTIRPRFDLGSGHIHLEELGEAMAEAIKNIDRVVVVACGTSYHSGLVGKHVIEKLARLPCDVEVASEFRYRDPLVDSRHLVIAVSQSGETADTLAAAFEARRKGAKVLSVCNVVGSSMARMADAVLYTHAGPEIGVASTKAFVCQMGAFYLLAGWMAEMRNGAGSAGVRELLSQVASIPTEMEAVLAREAEVLAAARQVVDSRSALYLGRGLSYPIALEGALKLKELSYIHAEGFAAGEMKHGPIALVDAKVPSVFIVPQGASYEKTISNIEEIKSRGGPVIAIAIDGDERINAIADLVLTVPPCSDLAHPFLTVLPLQLLAYHVADLKGTDVDQPRNLAKSVTVE